MSTYGIENENETLFIHKHSLEQINGQCAINHWHNNTNKNNFNSFSFFITNSLLYTDSKMFEEFF